MFYVDSKNSTLRCIFWSPAIRSDCNILATAPSISVAVDSQQISVTVLTSTLTEEGGQTSLLLIYEDYSRNLILCWAL